MAIAVHALFGVLLLMMSYAHPAAGSAAPVLISLLFAACVVWCWRRRTRREVSGSGTWMVAVHELGEDYRGKPRFECSAEQRNVDYDLNIWYHHNFLPL